MKLTIVVMAALLFAGLMIGPQTSTANRATGVKTTTAAVAQGERKMPDVIQLATASRLGTVNFSHTNHTTKNYNVNGTALLLERVRAAPVRFRAPPKTVLARSPEAM